MKKALALLLAFATAFGISVTAFADGVPENMADTIWYGENSGNVNNRSIAGNGTADVAGQNQIGVLPGDTGNTGVTGFANNGNTGNMGAIGFANGTDYTGDSGTIYMPETSGTTGISGATTPLVSPRSLDWADDEETNLTINQNEIFYVFAEGERVGSILQPGTLLTPGEEYKFNVFYALNTLAAGTADQLLAEGASARVTKGILGGGRLRVRTLKGSTSVASVTLDEKGSGTNAYYQLTVNAKENYGTKTNDVEYAIEVTGTVKADVGVVDLVKSGVAFKIGYRTMPDSVVESFEEGDIVTIYNDTPVITKKQFETLAKSANYKAITFEDENDNWIFTGRISGMSDTNWYNTADIIPSIVMEYPDNDFKFVNFHGGVKLPTNGEMRINVSDISTDYSNMYLYLSRGGALTPISAVYDRETDELVFKTNYLGTFIIADREIAAGVTEPTTPEEPDDEIPGTTNPSNPGTGASVAMDLISAIGLAALTGAGSLIRKKK